MSRDINFGADETDAKYQISDDGTPGDFVLARDTNGNTVLLKWSDTNSQWEYGGPVDLAGNDLEDGATTVYDASTDTVGDGTNTSADHTSVSTVERTVENVGGRGESNSTQSIGNSSATTVELDVVDQEDDSGVLDVDTSNNRIRVKKSGWIAMSASGNYAVTLGDGTRYIFQLAINGTNIAQDEGSCGADQPAGGTPNDIKDLSEDDDIQMTVFQDSGSSKDLRGDERVSLSAVHIG